MFTAVDSLIYAKILGRPLKHSHTIRGVFYSLPMGVIYLPNFRI